MVEQEVTIIVGEIESSGKITLDENNINLDLGITKQIINFNDIKVIEKNDDQSLSLVLADNSLIKLKLNDYLVLYKILCDYLDNKKIEPTSGIKCKECGEFNPANAKECGNCGYPLKSKKRFIIVFIITLLCIIILGSIIFVSIYLIKDNSKKEEKKESYTSVTCFTFIDGTITDYNEDCPKDVVIPKNINGEKVKVIGERSFYRKNINSVVFPDGLKKIKKYAFSGNNIKELVIPNSVTTINAGAFEINKITKVTLSNNLTLIGAWAFDYNYLEELVIPDSVKTINQEAFANNNLKKVYLGKSVETMEYFVFGQYNWEDIMDPNCEQNRNLTKIVNKTGREFDWYDVLCVDDTIDGPELWLETGIVQTDYSTVTIVKG